MKKFFNWVSRVIIGWWNVITHKKSKEAERRYNICKQCDKLLKIGKVQLCSFCGCVIPQKCFSPDEKCLNGKW